MASAGAAPWGVAAAHVQSARGPCRYEHMESDFKGYSSLEGLLTGAEDPGAAVSHDHEDILRNPCRWAWDPTTGHKKGLETATEAEGQSQRRRTKGAVRHPARARRKPCRREDTPPAPGHTAGASDIRASLLERKQSQARMRRRSLLSEAGVQAQGQDWTVMTAMMQTKMEEQRLVEDAIDREIEFQGISGRARELIFESQAALEANSPTSTVELPDMAERSRPASREVRFRTRASMGHAFASVPELMPGLGASDDSAAIATGKLLPSMEAQKRMTVAENRRKRVDQLKNRTTLAAPVEMDWSDEYKRESGNADMEKYTAWRAEVVKCARSLQLEVDRWRQ